MIMERKAAFLCDAFLTLFDVAINEFFHLAAGGADQVVVMIAFIELEHCRTRLEMTANDNACFCKLHQHPVNGCKGRVDFLVHQGAVDLLGRQVLGLSLIK